MHFKNIRNLLENILLHEKVSKQQLKEMSFGIELEMIHSNWDYDDFKRILEGDNDYFEKEEKSYYYDEGDEDAYPEEHDIPDSVTSLRSLRGWEVHRDASLSDKGTEFVSPPMDFETFVYTIPSVVALLKDVGFYGDSECGYHIGVSHETMNLSSIMKDKYKKLSSKYSPLVATMLSYNLNSKGLFLLGDEGRQEGRYSRDLSSGLMVNDNWVSDYLRANKKSNISLEDLIYKSDQFIDGDEDFRNSVDGNVHEVSMTRRVNYIEFRGLGGSDVFDKLSDESFVRKICALTASQALGDGYREDYTNKELFRILKPYLSNFFPEIFKTSSGGRVELDDEQSLYREILKLGIGLRDVSSRIEGNSEFKSVLTKLFKRYPRYDESSSTIKKILTKYPIESLYSIISAKLFRGYREYFDIVWDDIFSGLEKTANGVNIAKAIFNFIGGMDSSIVMTDVQKNKLLDILKGTGDILKYIPGSISKDNLLHLIKSDNHNDRFNAFKTLSQNGKFNLIPKDILDTIVNTLVDNKNYLALLAYVPEDMHLDLLYKYPDIMQDKLILSRPLIMKYYLDNYDRFKNMPFNITNAFNNLLSKYLSEGTEDLRNLIVRLVVKYPYLAETRDSFDREMTLAFIKAYPPIIRYLKRPFQAGVDLVRQLEPEKSKMWLTKSSKEFGYADVMDTGNML